MADAAGPIRVGVGGWTYEPWRGTFYPKGLRQAAELAYASRQITAIEINSTYTSSQKPASFAKWAAAVPDGFIFTVKGSRFCTNRRVLAQAGESVARFFDQGVAELGDRLGPILWQFMPTKQFDPDDFAAFLDLLPARCGGLTLRHAVEARHASFADPRFVALCRNRNVAVCHSDNANYPLIADVTADFAYTRLLRGTDEIATAYPASDLDDWAVRLETWARGETPVDLTPIDRTSPPPGPRPVFAFFIHEGKLNAPAAAMALISRLSEASRAG